MNTDVMFSSKSSEWETPKEFFSMLDKIFHFTLDPAATEDNRLCKKFFTMEDNALEQSWYGEVAFLNPPYGRKIALWMKKCAEEKEYAEVVFDTSPCPAREPRSLIITLIPSRTDTKWMHTHVYGKANWIIDIPGRLKFDNPLVDWGGKSPSSAPFPSRLVVYGLLTQKELWKLSKIGQIIKPISLYMMENGDVVCPELS